MKQLYKDIKGLLTEKRAEIDAIFDKSGNKITPGGGRAIVPSGSPSGTAKLPATISQPKIGFSPANAARVGTLAKIFSRGNVGVALATHTPTLNDGEDEELAKRRAADPVYKQQADKLVAAKDTKSVMDRYASSIKPKEVPQATSSTVVDGKRQAAINAVKTTMATGQSMVDTAAGKAGQNKFLPPPTKTAKEPSDFGKAFAAARKEKGAGGEFEFQGKKFNTNLKGEKPQAAAVKTPEPAASSEPTDRFAGPAKSNPDQLAGVKAASSSDPKLQPAMSYAGKNVGNTSDDETDAMKNQSNVAADSEDQLPKKPKKEKAVTEHSNLRGVYGSARAIMEKYNQKKTSSSVDEWVVPTARAAIAVAEPVAAGAVRFGASMLKNLFRNKASSELAPVTSGAKPTPALPKPTSKELTVPKPVTKEIAIPKPAPKELAIPKPVTKELTVPKPVTKEISAVPKKLPQLKRMLDPKVPKVVTPVITTAVPTVEPETQPQTQTKAAKLPPVITSVTTKQAEPETQTEPQLGKIPPPPPPPVVIGRPKGDDGAPKKSETQLHKIQPIPVPDEEKKKDDVKPAIMSQPNEVTPRPATKPRPYITPMPSAVKPEAKVEVKPAEKPQAAITPMPPNVEPEAKPAEKPQAVETPAPAPAPAKEPEAKPAPSVKPDWFVRTPGSPRKTADGKEEAGYLTSTPKKGEEAATHAGTDIPKSAVYHGTGAAEHAAQIRGHDWSKVKEYSSSSMQTGISGPAYKYDGKWHAGDPTSANMEVKKQKTVKEDIMSLNKKFGVTDDLYASVMEVLDKNKKAKEGSAPRNDKEKDLAAQFGNPNRITHGDVLKARGVIKGPKSVEEGAMKLLGRVAGAVERGVENVKKEFNAGRAEGGDSKPQASSKTTTGPAAPTEGTPSAGPSAKKDPGPAPRPQAQKSEGEVAANKYKNKSMSYESVGRRIAQNALSRMVEGATKINSPAENDKEREAMSFREKNFPTTYGTIARDARVEKSNKELGDREEKIKGVVKKVGKAIGIGENRDTPGNSYEHQCAIHVKSESFGEGRTVTTQHAEPDQYGNIAWYDVMFEHGIEKYVATDDLEILVSESHMHSKRKKSMSEDAASDRAENDARTDKTLAKMRERSKAGLGFNVSNTTSPATAAEKGDVSGTANPTANKTPEKIDYAAEREARMKKAEAQGAAYGRSQAQGGGGNLPVDKAASSTTAAPAPKPQPTTAPAPKPEPRPEPTTAAEKPQASSTTATSDDTEQKAKLKKPVAPQPRGGFSATGMSGGDF